MPGSGEDRFVLAWRLADGSANPRIPREVGLSLDDLRLLASIEGQPLPRGRALAEALGVSAPVAWGHIRRLKRLGALSLCLSVKPPPGSCECITYLQIDGAHFADLKSLDDRIAADPVVIQASRVTGKFDYRLHSVHSDYFSANDWSRNLESDPAVALISTRFSRTVFDRKRYAAAMLGSQ
jgi:DNA-binding Lrp family transcriptional regulator